VDKQDEYIFTAGYHDGKATVVKINEDGSVGKMTSEVMHKGMGSIAERNFRPHITCARLTPDQKFMVACDVGIDQVKIYKFDKANGRISLVDILRCELNSAPRSMLFSPDGKYAYLICQLMNCVNVYKYRSEGNQPCFEQIQQISTLGKSYNDKSAAAALRFSSDSTKLFVSNAGDNSVAFFERDVETGLLTKRSVLPISGDYPKQICVFPDDKHIASMNHESNTITFFKIDYEKGLLVMNGAPIKVETPNVAVIAKIEE
jgi:6-phosphogluconolactonase